MTNQGCNINARHIFYEFLRTHRKCAQLQRQHHKIGITLHFNLFVPSGESGFITEIETHINSNVHLLYTDSPCIIYDIILTSSLKIKIIRPQSSGTRSASYKVDVQTTSYKLTRNDHNQQSDRCRQSNYKRHPKNDVRLHYLPLSRPTEVL